MMAAAARVSSGGQAPIATLRAPEQVLRLARMGSFHQTRLSFMRVLLRHLARRNWQIERSLWEIDAKGAGVAVYEARGDGWVYSLIAFGHELDPEKRTDRVIAEEWDATFVLHDGVATRADIERLARNVPRQEAGRCSAAELVMSRANRSVRLFDHVVSELAQGRQPAAADLDAVGYLMRTTAVYGNGKFGLADRDRIAERPVLSGPFAAEMLTVWLIRAFTTDLVEHLATVRSPDTAVRLDRDLRRRLGVGNSTGLGMAPFVVNHPGLFHRWINARETALSRVLTLEHAGAAQVAVFRDRLARAWRQMAAWRVDDALQMARIAELVRDLDRLAAEVETIDFELPFVWRRLCAFAEAQLGLEAQELLVTLLLEPHGALVDDLSAAMGGDETPDFVIDGTATLADLRTGIEATYGFALAEDFTVPRAQARFWYVSEEKLEPRLGERALEEGAERELPLTVARDVAALHRLLTGVPSDLTIAEFLAAHPECRHAVRRVQLSARCHYAEVRDNLTGAELRPIDILRCKLSFFGATDFDPRSDRWVRVALFRHAPFPDELHDIASDDWAIPPLGRATRSAAAKAPSTGDITPSSPAEPEGYSLNEIEAEARKAARGTGLSWGLAEDVGRIARLLAHTRQLAMLADALDELKSGRHATGLISDRSGIRATEDRPLSPLVLASAIADRSAEIAEDTLTISAKVAEPRLLVPMLTSVAERLRRPLRLQLDGHEVVVGRDIAPALAALAEPRTVDTILISALPRGLDQASPPKTGGVTIPDELWRRFTALAALTYVPASEHSRLAGAGAGLSDND
ncbi:DUF3726 domain-containing protein [Aestuariivirga sp. YIM B02566]|uniref:DUF3726 domain-containing protein n=1 Tax=Taklimakanibacter albus TaxID=2800327 RepID=A0ACC5RAU7_9HYPH|nr:DUF3726 domain-containing protein [Aestuariivirga sp. YIM B02566]MBK1869772.1 DUF3726 domain-containing protein [Aestuariivirga sp. YIM B02566]